MRGDHADYSKKRNRRLVLQPARATSPIRHPKTIMNCDFPLTQATTALGMTDGQVALLQGHLAPRRVDR